MFDTKGKSFETIVEEVVEKYKDSSIEDKNKIIEYVTEEYVNRFGKKPDSYQLTLLANLILRDDITNPDSYKTQKEDYPFHSDSQRKRRKKKEFVAMDETLEFMNYKKKVNLSTAPPKDINLKGL
jgi:hypothetical protein